jgi:type I restriction enzyme M protein
MGRRLGLRSGIAGRAWCRRRERDHYIDKENWSAAGADVNGDAYEELLERSAEDTKSTAGQYFTPRALIQATVDVVQPTVDDTVVDPACGTGGFLLAAHSYVSRDAASFTRPEREHLRTKFGTGVDIGATTSRLASMNLVLHGLGSITGDSLIDSRDALIADPSERWSVVLANPPFGRSSSSDIGGADDDGAEIFRQDFVVTTSNTRLNFLQHIMTILDINGRAAVVLPDNVLFEAAPAKHCAASC